jgi:hypothetical protein
VTWSWGRYRTKQPMAKMSLRVGTCRIYLSDRHVICPLCRVLVLAGTHHECVVDDAGVVRSSDWGE